MSRDEKNWKFGSYGQPLDKTVAACIDKWETDRNISWQSDLALNSICSELAEDMQDLCDVDIPVENDEVFTRIEQFADGIIYSTNNVGKHSPIDDIGHSAEDYYNYPKFIDSVKEKIAIHIGKSVMSALQTAAKRTLDLERELMLLGRLQLSKTMKCFLSLVVKSYIWGFDAQCIVICRSAIEEALRSKIDYEILEKHFGNIHGKRLYQLPDYIEAAKREGVFYEFHAKHANIIRIRANSILHKDPNLTDETYSIIFWTVEIISMIETGEIRGFSFFTSF